MSSKSEPGVRAEADLFDLWAALWASKWLIIVMTLLGAAGGVAYALLATQWWRADTVVVQVDNKNLPGGLSQLSSLAGLAGININGGGSEQAPVAVLKSREFAAEFIEGGKLLPILFAEKWDAAAGRWKNDDPKKQPDIRDGVRFFEKSVRSVSEDKKSGLLTLSITWKDPALSAEWANGLIAKANQKLREQALSESERNIEYLRGEMLATNVPSLQQSIGKVLEAEMQKMLLARGREQYAFRVIDHATVPKQRDKPQRALVAIFGTVAGGALGVFIVLLRRSRRASEGRTV